MFVERYRQTKVSDFDVAGGIEEDVTRFKVPVDHPLGMYMCQAFHYLSEELPLSPPVLFVKLSRVYQLSDSLIGTVLHLQTKEG